MEDTRAKTTQDIDELSQLQKDSLAQKLPEQKVVFKAESIKFRAGRRGVHNLPDPSPISDIVERIATIAKLAILENGGRMQMRNGEPIYIINYDF